MSRRIWVLAIVLAVLFLLLLAQSSWVQVFHAQALDNSPLNPRNSSGNTQYQRGAIYAADGTVLAKSVPTSNPSSAWKRLYPLGSLTAGVVGFISSEHGEWGLEAQYNSELSAKVQPADSLEQMLTPTSKADSITLTLLPALQRLAKSALGERDGSVVVSDPRSGAILALFSNPTFNPVPFTSTNPAVQAAAWKKDTTNNAHGYPPLGLVATQQTIFPGSTFKVITTAGLVAYKPSLMSMSYPLMTSTALPDSDKRLENDGGAQCGGTVLEMLPESCDPGYALLGLALGAQDLTKEADAFGFNQVPPLDLPGVVASYFPKESYLAANPPFLAYSAIGQYDVGATALENDLVASAIADHGVIMTPHLLSYVTSPDGSIVSRYKDSVWKRPLTASQDDQIVPLMRLVVLKGTADLVNFPAVDDVAAKTGTAQLGNKLTNDTDDWMIAFAPANDPTVAIAVSVPFQKDSATGASIAGPIARCMIEETLALQAHRSENGAPPTC